MGNHKSALEKKAIKWEVKRFPDRFKNGLCGNIYSPPHRKDYFYFGPSYHIKSGLINEEIIDNLSNTDKTLFSVGSGGAFLERFLVEGFGIDKSRVILSDIYTKDLPKSFRKYKFDMDKEWPILGEFDYIIFPESISYNFKYEEDINYQIALKHYIINSLKNLKQVGQIRLTEPCQTEEIIETVRRELERDYPDLQLMYPPNLIIVKRGKKFS